MVVIRKFRNIIINKHMYEKTNLSATALAFKRAAV